MNISVSVQLLQPVIGGWCCTGLFLGPVIILSGIRGNKWKWNSWLASIYAATFVWLTRGRFCFV